MQSSDDVKTQRTPAAMIMLIRHRHIIISYIRLFRSCQTQGLSNQRVSQQNKRLCDYPTYALYKSTIDIDIDLSLYARLSLQITYCIVTYCIVDNVNI